MPLSRQSFPPHWPTLHTQEPSCKVPTCCQVIPYFPNPFESIWKNCHLLTPTCKPRKIRGEIQILVLNPAQLPHHPNFNPLLPWKLNFHLCPTILHFLYNESGEENPPIHFLGCLTCHINKEVQVQPRASFAMTPTFAPPTNLRPIGIHHSRKMISL